jgi:hypothetical protein
LSFVRAEGLDPINLLNPATFVELIVCFVDIGGIVVHHCISFLCFVDIDVIIDHHCLNLHCFVDIGGIVDHHSLSLS